MHELLALGRERAELRKGARSHVRIGRGGVIPVAGALHGAGGVDTRADGLRRFPGRWLGELVKVQRRHLDDDVDAVEQRAGYARMVAAHVARRAAAAPRGMPVPAALAGVHGAHEHEAARIRHGAGRARDGDAAVLERLAHRLEHGGRKLRQLIEKEHAVVGKAHLTRLQRAAAAGHGDVRHRVVRGAKRPDTHDGIVRRRETEDGIDLRGLDHFGAVHRGQNGRQALGEHGLARARRSDEQDVVPARCRYLKRALDVLLRLDLGKIDRKVRRGRKRRRRHGRDGLVPAQMVHELRDVLDRVHGHALGKGGLGRVARRDKELPETDLFGRERHRERAGDGADLPREAHLAEERRRRRRLADLPRGAQDAQQHRQVIERAGLARVRRGEVHRQAADRKLHAVGLDGAAHALARLLDGRIRQADDIKPRQTVGHVALHAHGVAAHTAAAEGLDLGQQTVRLLSRTRPRR